jgi:succinate dehydrogenase flavin-adding protein (antitoxin of CptAB toxin-antitoxin module)
MSPAIVRLFWDSVNQAHPNHLLNLDDDGLMRWLVDQVKQRSALDSHISDRLPLIREMAYQN